MLVIGAHVTVVPYHVLPNSSLYLQLVRGYSGCGERVNELSER